MNDSRHAVVTLIGCYARHTGLSVGTVSLYASGSGATYARLRAGADITTRRAARIVQWLSDHWPASATWPTDIPRPAPSPDGSPNPPAGGRPDQPSPAPAPPSPAGVPARGGPSTAAPGPAGRGAIEPAGPAASLKERLQVASSGSVTAPSAGPAVPTTTPAAPALAAWPLDTEGHVVDEAALADALGVRPATLYTTIARYADGRDRAHRWPRGRVSDTARALRALLATGDARFARRRALVGRLTGAAA